MSDSPVIDLTEQITDFLPPERICFPAPNNVENTVTIELVDDILVETNTSPTRSRLRRRTGSRRRVVNEEPILIPDSPLVDTTAEIRTRRRNTKTSKNKQVSKDDNEQVRDRSPLSNNSPVCPICLEKLGTQPLVSTKCGHVYCHNCLTQALRVEKKCPTCRKVLRGSTAYHPLYLNRR